jgi:hypothetical protein
LFADKIFFCVVVVVALCFRHSLKEVLADPSISSRLETTKAFSEVRALDTFFEMLNTDPDRAYYGFAHVRRANEAKAIDTLLVTDELFRSSDMRTRRDYVALVESVKENGGDVKIFSTLHVSGEQLNQLSGVAALLRFPMPEAEVDVDDESGEGADEVHGNEDDFAEAPAGGFRISASMHQLSSHLPASSASASAAAAAASPSSAAPSSSSSSFKRGGGNIASSVSFNNLGAMRSSGVGAPSSSPAPEPSAASASAALASAAAAAAPAKGGIIKGFASEHGM